ncbi:MAG: CNNM domain-containing protein [Planctomycetota bacterium]|nr:CNNM domain-containing protein [Planctomycetota bacterium]
MIWLSLLTLVLLVALSALFSGSETGFYSCSRMRIDAEAEAGHGSSLWIQRLLRDEAGLLITILIGNNLAIELVTHLAEHEIGRTGLVSDGWRDLVVTLALTPVLFFFAELWPKDLFRRRPYTLLGITVRPMVLFYVLFWPLMIVLRGLGVVVQRIFGVGTEDLYRARGREVVIEVLEESTRGGALELRAESLARNALTLSTIPVSEVMTPWSRVEKLELGDPGLFDATALAEHSRLPISEDGVVLGYVHQLELLSAGPDQDPHRLLHQLAELAPDTSVQEALGRLRVLGKRAALVGDPAEPLGLVSLKDLAERISGDLAGW